MVRGLATLLVAAASAADLWSVMRASDAACAASAAGRRVAAFIDDDSPRGVVFVPDPSRGGLGTETNRFLHVAALGLALGRGICLNMSASPSYRFLAPKIPIQYPCNITRSVRFSEASFEDLRDPAIAVLFDRVPIVSPYAGLMKRIADLVGSDYMDVVACLSVAWLRPGPEVRERARPFLYAFRHSVSVGVHMRTADTAMIREQCYQPESHGCGGRGLRLAFHNRANCIADDDQLIATLATTVLPSCVAKDTDVAIFIAADHPVVGTSWLDERGAARLGNATVLTTAGRPQHTGRPSPLASHAEAEFKAVFDLLLLTETTVYVSNCDLRCNFWVRQGKCGNSFASNVMIRRAAPQLALTSLFAPRSPGNFTCPARLSTSIGALGAPPS